MKRYILLLFSLLFMIMVKGQSYTNPLYIGVKSAAFEYKHTAAYYNPNYEPTIEKSVGYRLYIATPMRVTISHQGSQAESTAISLGDHIYSESSNGECSSKDLAFLDAGILTPGYYHVYSVTKHLKHGSITTTIKGTPCSLDTQPRAMMTNNYIIKSIPTVPSTTGTNLHYTECIQNVTYYDGLGYPVENIAFKASPDGSDLVTYQEYNSEYKESNSWLPAVMSDNNGDFVELETFKSKARNTYGDFTPYSNPIYDGSPLYRVKEQYGPGQNWRTAKKSAKIEYLTNNVIENHVLTCEVFKITDTKVVVHYGYYASGLLHVTKTTDEDGKNITYEFKNKIGQLLLSRQVDGDKHHDTYFIYDDLGNLCAVLPPMIHDFNGNLNWMVDRYAYLYDYDGKKRLIGKKLPGAGWVRYVYDNADRMIFSQDGEQSAKNQWFFYLYDNLNRQVLHGICSSKSTPNIADIKVTTSFVASDTGIKNSGYSTNIELVSLSVLQANYYDDYSFRNLSGFNNENFPVPTHTGKGKLTASVAGVLGINISTKLYSANYYDAKGNLIDVVSSNYLGGYDKTTTTYTFTGKPKTVQYIHTATGKITQTQLYTYTYDHVERLKTVTHKLNDGNTVTLTDNTYDSLGRLQKNSRNGVVPLTDNYEYNIRSWVTRIAGIRFMQNLTYKDNGDIHEMSWVDNYSKYRKYVYDYDGLSRLTSASYSNIFRNEKYDTSYEYDKHGNITKLMRYGKTAANTYDIVDSLTFDYMGNQLINVTESAPDVSLPESNDFKKKAYTGNGYTYNKNGAMTKDLNKGIAGIGYNSLSLPLVVTMNGSSFIYTYSTNGKKLRVSKSGNTRDYVGNIIYENGSLKRILVTGGYIEDGVYYFNLNDHQGNTRVVVNANGDAIQTNHYYPFGLPFAETSSTDQGKQPYKYNGKEFDRTNGMNLYDYSARYMDPSIGRFTTMDPMAEKYYSSSPYAYCLNNPLKYVDPTGKDHITINPEDKTVFVIDVGDNRLGIDYVFLNGVETQYEHGSFNLDEYKEQGYRILRGRAVGFEITDAALLTLGGEFAFVKLFGYLGKLGQKLFGNTTKNAVGSTSKTLAIHKVGDLLESIDDIIANPNLLKGKGPAQIEGLVGKTPGWKIEKLGKGKHKGMGMILREYGDKGPTGRMIQWHPGGGHHGSQPYWKVSSGNGTFRIFDQTL